MPVKKVGIDMPPRVPSMASLELAALGNTADQTPMTIARKVAKNIAARASSRVAGILSRINGRAGVFVR